MPFTPPRAKSLQRTNDSDTTNKIHQTNQWKEISKTHRTQYPLCQRCQYMGFITRASTEQLSVHHIVSLARNINKCYDADNLLTLCVPCHQEFTDLENAGLYDQAEAEGRVVRDATSSGEGFSF